MTNDLNDDQYNYCPVCGVIWELHPEGDCDEGRLIELEKPRFYMLDLDNYTDDFLKEIILWMDKKIEFLEAKNEKN